MSFSEESDRNPEYLVLVRHADPSLSVWHASNGIGELELFTNFRMLIDRQQRLVRVAASIPEELLLKAGFVFPEVTEINDSPQPSLQYLRKPDTDSNSSLPIIDAEVRTTDRHTGDSFLGASVEALSVNAKRQLIGADLLPIAQYVQESTWEAPEILTHLNFHGWFQEDFANGVALTVQNALELNA